MPQIDALLTQMHGSGAQSATLRADAPLQLQFSGNTTKDNVTEGATLSSARIEELLREIAPPEAQSALETEGVTSFDYASPLGICRVQAMRSNGIFTLQIVPDFAAPQVISPQMVMPSGITPPVMAIPDNDSGQKTAKLPTELQGFNWGGLLLSWVWAIGNKSWLGLLGLIPIVGFFVRFFLGFKGNEMAWRGRKWQSVEQFRATQKTWMAAGLCIVLLSGFFILPVAAILFPVFARARENARRSSCQQNMKQISLGVRQYTFDSKGNLPPGTTMMSWKASLKPYLKSEEIYYCPSVTRGEESYLVNRKIAGVNVNTIPNPSQTPLFYEAEVGHLGGINVAFVDGHIKWFRNEVFDSELRPLIQ